MTDAYSSISEKLNNIGLYRITSGSFIEAELKAYAAGLQLVCDELDELLCECFISTACARGLEFYGSNIPRGVHTDQTEQRRSRIICARSLEAKVLTRDAMERLLGVFGISGSITDSVGNITINPEQTLLSTEKETIRQQLQRLMPLGTTVTIV